MKLPSVDFLPAGRMLRLSVAICLLSLQRIHAADRGELVFKSLPQAQYHFDGIIGHRVRQNVEHWLIPAPAANPGMLEMFRLRDRLPAPNLVPWAGEFVGKYLISAIQALRMTNDAELRALTGRVVADLIATQAEDGYLGPFPKPVRLKSNWDLWGHYHCMEALLMWHEATADPAALKACQRAADLICKTFLETDVRVFDAGSQEMNMAVIHALGRLHRLTGAPRYFQMMKEIEKDWERAGDYLRTGLARTEFFQTPRPRWESLHDLQGLVELYRITGEPAYRDAFIHHWRSILRWDRRNTGGFSSGEQATGNPYAATAIETCCTIAWTALTIDMLQLTGDSLAADELELSTFNAVAGAQHPSGRWWTYNTPMEGARESSAHSIVFQARSGTPELNCCSVNGPRGLGELSEWAVMQTTNGLAVNYYGPGTFQGKLEDNTPIALQTETDYPLFGKVQIRVEPLVAHAFTLKLRIPAWSKTTSVRVNNTAVPNVIPGQYLDLDRRWREGDRIAISFDLQLRAVPGDREAAGRVSLYRGPLLLAYDPHYNAFDEQALPLLDLRQLPFAKTISTYHMESGPLEPWLLVDVATKDGSLRLCDFASAGTHGTRYRSWLPVMNSPPPAVVTRAPADGARLPRGPALFRWSGPKPDGVRVSQYQIQIAQTPDFTAPSLFLKGIQTNRLILDERQMRSLETGRDYYWKIVAVNAYGTNDSVQPFARFVIDPTLPATALPSAPADILLTARLNGTAQPEIGVLQEAPGSLAAEGPTDSVRSIETDGVKGRLIYRLAEFPDENYSLALRLKLRRFPDGHLGQVFSAWAAPMDDPLRLCVEGGKLFGRIEAGQGFSTTGVPLQTGSWYHVALVKAAGRLSLYLNGRLVSGTDVPLFVQSSAREVALGGNPRFSGNEFLAAQFANVSLYARALSAAEISEAAKAAK